MKVLFMGVGLVHYFNGVLNRLNAFDQIEIVNLVPSNTRGHLQTGVYQTRENARFETAELKERTLPSLYHSFRGLHRFLRRERPDIIVTTEYYVLAFMVNPLLMVTLKALGTKIILKSIPFRVKPYRKTREEIGLGPRRVDASSPLAGLLSRSRTAVKWLRRLQLEINRRIYRFPDAHVNYIEEACPIFESYGVPGEKIFITYNSPDTDELFRVRKTLEREPRILPECDGRLIHIGRLVPWKRVDILIRSFARIRKKFPGSELVIVGEGPEGPRLRALAERLGMGGAVRFVGGVYHPAALGRYLLSANVYVLAGMGGLSINDAMCFGLPVICSVCDGTEKRLVIEGYNGLYFEKGNEKDLADKIIHLFNNPQMIKKMGSHSTDIIKKEINIQSVINGYLNAFNYVMQNQL